MKPSERFESAGFAILRTPLLPVSALTSMIPSPAGETPALSVPGDHASRADLVDERLRELLQRSEVREALAVASPTLLDAIAAWEASPTAERAVGVPGSIARYLGRMASRSTPFGLFASTSFVNVGEETRLEVGGTETCSRHVRLDMQYLTVLVTELERVPAVRAKLIFRPNNALNLRPEQIHYPFAPDRGQGGATFSLVSAPRTAHVVCALERAVSGATLTEIADAVVASAEVPQEEATDFVGALLEAQLLVSELVPPLTGPDPLDHLVSVLSRVAPDHLATRALRTVRERLAALMALPIGVADGIYEEVAELLGVLPAKVDRNRLFQVDMYRDGSRVTLGRELVNEIGEAALLLQRISSMGESNALASFRRDFEGRYGDREVPLLDALDDELGVGFPLDGETAGSDEAPLLAGLQLAPAQNGPAEERVDAFLLTRLTELLCAGAYEWKLTDDDLESLTASSPLANASPSFVAMCRLLSVDSRDPAAPAFELNASWATTPARLLGRFCQGDPAIERAAVALTAREATCFGPVVLAEVVHLPVGRLANVSLRPVLRDYEIPYLATSGAPEDRQLAPGDLMVSVRGGRIWLRSQRLNRWILPRITNAHNHGSSHLAVYRFLGALQYQGIADASFQWGAMERSAFLPRVTRGRVVLHRARWTIPARDLTPIVRAAKPARAAVVEALRVKRRLPRCVLASSNDTSFLVDLENPASVEGFIGYVSGELNGGASSLTLVESLESSFEPSLRGDRGGHASELLVPFWRAEPVVARPPPLPRPAEAREWERRPGDDWLYVKLYGGTASADAVLTDMIAPAMEAIQERGLADQWFFLRYADPKPHLRLRLHGEGARLLRDALPSLLEVVRARDRSGDVTRVQVDTYQREVSRYGGPIGMALSERIFWADSEATLAIVQHPTDGAVGLRWHAALLGMHRLLIDFGCDLEERLAVVTAAAAAFRSEYAASATDDRAFGDKFRAARGELEALLAGRGDMLAAARASFDRRSSRIAAVARELDAAGARSELSVPVKGPGGLVGTHLHMFATRMFPSENRRHEAVIYDFLRRLYEGEKARARGRARPARLAATVAEGTPLRTGSS